MKRLVLVLLPLPLLWLLAQNATQPASPVSTFPRGAMAVVETKDFGKLLGEWNASQAKKEWLAGDAYKVWLNSRLGQRLSEAQDQFTEAATLGLDSVLMEQLAGDRTAIALYDAGELEFLAVSRMPEARFAASALAGRRASLQPRNAGGTPYFVSSNAATRRTVAFAFRGEWAIVGTTESLVAECLQRIASAQANGLSSEGWYARAARASSAEGEVRLVTNIDALSASPHFRSYWIHRNRSELQPYVATISDLDRSAGAWVERRSLVRKQTQSAASSAVDWPSLLRAVPANAGLYRAWAEPDSSFTARTLINKFAQPGGGAYRDSNNAPSLGDNPEAGGESDWETDIADAPFHAEASGIDAARLSRWLAAQRLSGMLQVQSTRDVPGNVWIGYATGVVLAKASNWSEAEARAELGALGALIDVDGNRLFIANNGAALAALRSASANAPSVPASAVFTGGFRHANERTRYRRWMARIEQPFVRPLAQGEQRAPDFIEDIVPSLSRVVNAVNEQTVVVADPGDRVTQTITYRIAP